MAGNEEQVAYWNEQAGRVWVEAQERLDHMLAPLSQLALDQAAAEAGERVIDVGCGCGDTAIAMARNGAAVWGIDISAPMLERAKARAAGLDNVAFSVADASGQAYTPDHQLVFSRFGVMFFDDPVAAFSNIRRALTPDGRLVFVCWQAAGANEWLSVAGRAIAPHLPAPAEPPDPRAPGPFAFAEPDYVTDLLQQAGYSDIDVAAVGPTLHVADNLDQAMEFQSRIGPVARVIAELDAAARERALADARAALAERLTGDGINLASAAWIVSARPG